MVPPSVPAAPKVKLLSLAPPVRLKKSVKVATVPVVVPSFAPVMPKSKSPARVSATLSPVTASIPVKLITPPLTVPAFRSTVSAPASAEISSESVPEPPVSVTANVVTPVSAETLTVSAPSFPSILMVVNTLRTGDPAWVSALPLISEVTLMVMMSVTAAALPFMSSCV